MNWELLIGLAVTVLGIVWNQSANMKKTEMLLAMLRVDIDKLTQTNNRQYELWIDHEARLRVIEADRREQQKH